MAWKKFKSDASTPTGICIIYLISHFTSLASDDFLLPFIGSLSFLPVFHSSLLFFFIRPFLIPSSFAFGYIHLLNIFFLYFSRGGWGGFVFLFWYQRPVLNIVWMKKEHRYLVDFHCLEAIKIHQLEIGHLSPEDIFSITCLTRCQLNIDIFRFGSLLMLELHQLICL